MNVKTSIKFKCINGVIDIISSIGEVTLGIFFPTGAITFAGIIALIKNISCIYLDEKADAFIKNEKKSEIKQNIYSILKEFIQSEIAEDSSYSKIDKYIDMTMQSYQTLNIDDIDKYSFKDICSKIEKHVESLYKNTSPSNQKIISILVIYVFNLFCEAFDDKNRIRFQTRINMQFHSRISRLEETIIDSEDEIKRNVKACSEKFTEILYLHKDTSDGFDKEISLKNLFVEPIVKTHNISSLVSNELLTCFTSEEFKKDKYTILFGAAGSGKTSIVYRLAYSYFISDEKKEQLFNNKELIIIRLRYLNKSDIRNNGLYYAICNYLDVKTENDIFLDKYVILDGLDEISLNYEYSFYESILDNLITQFSEVYKLIITSRPGVFEDGKEHSKWRIYSILPFSEDKKKEWIQKYESLTGTPISQDIKDYILPRGNNSASIFDYPQLMYMIAVAKPNDKVWSLDNKWSIYHNIFYNEILNRNYENDKVDKPNREVIEYIYKLLKEYSFTIYLNQSNNTNDSKNIYQIRRGYCNDVPNNDEIFTAIEQYGYRFGCYWKHDDDMVEIEFYHNNIRDFFIAEYIYDHLNSLFESFPNNKYTFDGFSIENVEEYDQLEEIAKKLYFLLSGIPISKEIVDFIESRTEYKLRDEYDSDGKNHDSFFEFMRNNVLIDSKEKATDTLNRGVLFVGFLKMLFTNPRIISDKKNTTEYDTIHLFANFLNNFLTVIFSILRYSKSNKIPLFYLDLDLDGLISSAYIPTKYYRYINLSGANLSAVHLFEANLSRAILKEVNLRFSSFLRCNLQDVCLINANLENAMLNFSNLSEANLTGANLESADLQGSNFEEAILEKANMVDVNLISAILIDAELTEANLTNANLMGANLHNANLHGAVLRNAILCVADLRGADLTGADLQGADLRGANLSNVDLSNAIVDGAKFDGAD